MQHPEMNEEKKHLAKTIEYMEAVLENSTKTVESTMENIRTSMADLEYLDSSSSYLNILTNTRFFDMAQNQSETLQTVMSKPYFARIHFEKEGELAEKLYIGKTSLFHQETQEPIIVDWRSPVANVYYDGRLGDLTYEVNNIEYNGHLYSKRQYKIEQGELLEVRDIDLTTNDELLQDALAGKADVRLTEIVSTIQAEQNEIIRAHLKQPIIVQGAAGSGKTTIALHRISYFLYMMGEHFNAEDLMILAPNKLFIDYIGDVLPELGVGKIRQTTFTEYVLQATQLKLNLQDQNTILNNLLRQNANNETIQIAKFKGSLAFKDCIDSALEQLARDYAKLFEDIYIEKYRILRKSHLQKLFLIEYAYLPIDKRFAKIRAVIQNHVRQKKKQVIHNLQAKYDEILGKALNIFDATRRKKEVTKWIDERDTRIPAIEKEAKTVTASYMKRFEKVKVRQFYRTLLTTPTTFKSLNWSSTACTQFMKAHLKEQWNQEDLAALFYIQAKIKGIKDEHRVRVVFIDEVQDYSLFQIAALKEGLGTDMFTMVGDLAQGIHSYRSLNDWTPVKQLFERASYQTLQKSYRTTIEIMALANTILSKMTEDLPLVEPVVRHGLEPKIHRTKTFNPKKIKTLVEEIRQNGHQSIALICKTNEEAIQMARQLNEHSVVAQSLTESSAIDQNTLLVLPCHLSKGLEFDAVIVQANEDGFLDNPLERKLLYVAITRAMHELHLVGPTKKHFLL